MQQPSGFFLTAYSKLHGQACQGILILRLQELEQLCSAALLGGESTIELNLKSRRNSAKMGSCYDPGWGLGVGLQFLALDLRNIRLTLSLKLLI